MPRRTINLPSATPRLSLNVNRDANCRYDGAMCGTFNRTTTKPERRRDNVARNFHAALNNVVYLTLSTACSPLGALNDAPSRRTLLLRFRTVFAREPAGRRLFRTVRNVSNAATRCCGLDIAGAFASPYALPYAATSGSLLDYPLTARRTCYLPCADLPRGHSAHTDIFWNNFVRAISFSNSVRISQAKV